MEVLQVPFQINILLFLLFVNLAICDEESYNKYIGYVDEIEISFADRMHKELNLNWCGTFHGMHEKVEQMGMDFHASRKASVEEARALELYVIDQFLETIEKHEKIKPFLEKYPFEKVHMSIRFNGILGPSADGTVTTVSNSIDPVISNSRIFYSGYDPYKDEFQDLLVETYDQAKRLNAAFMRDPAIHKTLAGEKEVDELLLTFINQMAKKYRIKIGSIGTRMNQSIEEFGAIFTAFQPATQEEARKLMVDVVEDFLFLVQHDAKIKPFLKEPLLPLLKLRINFREDLYYVYRNGSIDSVTLDNNQLTYFQHIPLKEGEYFPLPSETPTFSHETYDEALKDVQNHPEKYTITLSKRLKGWLSSAFTKLILTN